MVVLANPSFDSRPLCVKEISSHIALYTWRTDDGKSRKVFGAFLGHFWGTLELVWGTLGALFVSVYDDLDPIGIVLFHDGRFGQVVLLPMSVEIGKAHS